MKQALIARKGEKLLHINSQSFTSIHQIQGWTDGVDRRPVGREDLMDLSHYVQTHEHSTQRQDTDFSTAHKAFSRIEHKTSLNKLGELESYKDLITMK